MKSYVNLAAMGHRDFRLYIIGNVFSLHGMWIQRVSLAWIAWEMSLSASFVGFVAFLGFAPTLLTGPVFGVLSDRAPLQRAAMITQGGLGFVAFLILLAHITGALNMISLSVLSLCIGILMSANHPIRMSLTPLLVPKEEITSVILASSLNFNLARVLGPAIGGIVIAKYGVTTALSLVVLFYVPAVIILPRIRPRPRTDAAPIDETIWKSLHAGAIYAWRAPLIRHVLSITATYTFCGRGILEILPSIADGIFARGASGLGTMTAAAGGGALISAVLVTLLPPAQAGARPVLGQFAAVVGLILVLVLGQSTNWHLSLLCVAILGACSAQFGVAMQSALQLVLNDTYRGRVMSLWIMLGIGAASIGALTLGILSDQLGLRMATLLIDGAALVGFLALLRKS